MGMYTGVKFVAELSTFGEQVVALVENPGEARSGWELASEVYHMPRHAFLREWAAVRRCEFIPHGVLAYMPDGWAEVAERKGLHGRTWYVCCSLKNYEGEVETFLRTVLPKLIAVPCVVDVLYEEWEHAEHWNITPEELDAGPLLATGETA